MNTRGIYKDNTLVSTLDHHLKWNKARTKFLAMLIQAMFKLQTVNFIKLSQGIGGNALPGSKLRRVQRFFADFALPEDTLTKLLFAMLPNKTGLKLCLDRTNWKFGKTNINILMLSVAHKGVSFPLMWKLLPKRGNSNCAERKELFDKYIDLFGIKSITSLIADREFIGESWFDELIRHKVRFYIRLRENMKVHVPGKGQKRAFWLFNDLELNVPRYYHKPVTYRGRYLYLSGSKVLGKKNKLEFVIIASYLKGGDALKTYRERWQIETMFRAFKSSGFNLEQTHLTDIKRISKLVAVVCIAFSWAYKIGIYLDRNVKPIKVKKHGRRAMSYFKYGLNFIAHALLNTISDDYVKCVKLLSCT